MSKKPVLTPPVQRIHFGYWTARLLVSQGVKRFHRISIKEGFELLPKGKEPVILVSNHQNGMMDPLNICGVFSKQFHWLTRADVFWKSFPRMMMFSFNQMPIYRQRDRLADAKERNDIIWDTCIERLNIGAALALFPEGNHNSQRTIRNLKRGVSDLLGKAVTKHESLKNIKLVPLGLDYEDYPTFRRRLSMRVGKSIEWNDLYNKETGLIDSKALSVRIQDALRELTVDLQPYDAYSELDPYSRAMRTTEMEGQDWEDGKSEILRIKNAAEDEGWLKRVKEAFEGLKKAGYKNSMRPEAWGHEESEVRGRKAWAKLLYPLAWVSNIPSVIQQFVIDKQGEKVKAKEFRSTMKVGAGMFLYPLTWTILAVVFGYLVRDMVPMWLGFFAFWSWATWGNKFYSWLIGNLYDHKDAIEGEEFWTDSKNSNLREAWKSYIAAIKS